MIEHDPVIGEYEHEKFRPREAEALQTLRKVASLVKPIMRQRGWTVGILTEFWPPEKNLLGLNWNKGQKICLRLRYPYDEKQFISLEEVVDTMLHELCHIVHGPHNEAFNNLWNQLRSEHEALMRKGYTGEGFLSTGHKLGGARIPMHEARRRAREAAEKRKTLTAGSGQRLGGAPVRRGADIRKVIADAATRRITVTKGCASNTERSRGLVEESTKNGFRTKADEENANEEAIMQAYIEMIQEDEREKYGKDYVPPSKSNPGGSQGMAITIESESESEDKPQPAKPGPEASSSKPMPVGPKNSEEPHPPKSNPQEHWPCEVCTLSNPPTFLCCDACGTERPLSSLTSSPSTKPSYSSRGLASHTRAPAGDVPSKSSKSIRALSSLSAVESKKPLGWADKPLHKLLCPTVKHFADPKPSFRRAIFFPSDEDCSKFIWIETRKHRSEAYETMDLDKELDLSGEKLFNVRKSTELPPVNDLRGKRPLRHKLVVHFRDHFVVDGSTPNRSIINAARGKQKVYWKGPLVALAYRVNGTVEPILDDVTVHDLRDIVDWFCVYDGSETSVLPVLPTVAEVPTFLVKAVRVNCPGHMRSRGEEEVVEFEVRSDHPMFKNTTTIRNITHVLEIPLVTYSIPAGTEWAKDDELAFAISTSCLQLSVDPPDLARTLEEMKKKPKYATERGSIVFAILDQKELLPEHFGALLHFCENDVVNLADPATTTTDSGRLKDVFEKHVTQQRFKSHWRMILRWMMRLDLRWGNVPSPYEMPGGRMIL